jgi:hypothetical protein
MPMRKSQADIRLQSASAILMGVETGPSRQAEKNKDYCVRFRVHFIPVLIILIPLGHAHSVTRATLTGRMRNDLARDSSRFGYPGHLKTLNHFFGCPPAWVQR